MDGIKLELSRTQLEGFLLLLEAGLNLYAPKDMAEQLIEELVHDLKERVRNKVIKGQRNPKVSSQITLKSKEAKAFYFWFCQMWVLLADSHVYECIIADDIRKKIDKKYG